MPRSGGKTGIASDSNSTTLNDSHEGASSSPGNEKGFVPFLFVDRDGLGSRARGNQPARLRG